MEVEGDHKDNDETSKTHLAMIAMADTFITIVGDAFRQRDLLSARDMLWPLMESEKHEDGLE